METATTVWTMTATPRRIVLIQAVNNDFLGGGFHEIHVRIIPNDLCRQMSINSALYKIGQIEEVSFNWRDQNKFDDQTPLGVIAQQVEGVFPELVFTSNDEMGTKSVDYNGLISPLIEAVKELKAQKEAIQEQSEALQKQNAAFKELLCQDHPTAAICR